jgi:hypothetical protein
VAGEAAVVLGAAEEAVDPAVEGGAVVGVELGEDDADDCAEASAAGFPESSPQAARVDAASSATAATLVTRATRTSGLLGKPRPYPAS